MIPRQESDHPIDKIRFGLMVAIGGEDSSETLELVTQQEKIARRELEEVPQRAEARGEEFLEHTQETRAALMSELKLYHEWLVKTKEALEQHDTSTVVETYEESQEILPRLNEALEAYSEQFSSFGPFTTAPANTLLRIAQGLESSEVPQGAWMQYCNHYQQGIEERIESLAELELPGKTLAQENYHISVDNLVELSGAVPKTSMEVMGSLKNLDLAFHRAQTLEEQISEAGSGDGPTPIPATNVLLSLLDGSAGKLPQEMQLALIEDYGELMDRFTEQFENAASRPSDSALIQEEVPRTLDNLDAHYAAIEELGDAIEQGQTDRIPEILGNLKSTASKLEESREVYETAAQHQNQLVCPSCSRPNPPENRNCEACGEALPRPEDAGATSSSTFSVLSGPALEENQQLEMTENVARLFQACDDVAVGNITPEQFQGEVQLARAGLKEFSDEMDGIAATALDETNFTPEQLELWQSTHLPYLEDVALTFQTGLEEAAQGLETMEMFLSDPNEEHLVEGIRLTWQGLSAIHRGQLSLETYNNMLQDVMQEAAEEGLLTEG